MEAIFLDFGAGAPQLKRNPLGSMHLLEWLGIVPKDQRQAIRLVDPECWRVQPTQDAVTFFRALTTLGTADSVLYLEGCTEEEVPRFLEPRQVANPTPVALGTILPRSDRYHISATSQNLVALADLVDAYRVSPPAIHVLLYRGRQVLVEWYDAFADDPIYISSVVREPDVRRFAEAVRSEYQWTKHAA